MGLKPDLPCGGSNIGMGSCSYPICSHVYFDWGIDGRILEVTLHENHLYDHLQNNKKINHDESRSMEHFETTYNNIKICQTLFILYDKYYFLFFCIKDKST